MTTQVNGVETSSALHTQEIIEATAFAMENMQIEEQDSSKQISKQENNNNASSVSDSEIYLIVSRHHGIRKRLSRDGRRIGLHKPYFHHCYRDLGLCCRRAHIFEPGNCGKHVGHREVHGFGPGHRREHGFGPRHRGEHGFGPGHRREHGFGPRHRGEHGLGPGHRGEHGFGPGHRGEHEFGFENRGEHGSGHVKPRDRHDIPEIIKCALEAIRFGETDEMRKILETQKLKSCNRHAIKGAHGPHGMHLHRRNLRLRSLSPHGYSLHGKCGLNREREICRRGLDSHVYGSFGKLEIEGN